MIKRNIHNKYYNSNVNSKENLLYNFVGAYFHQDVDYDDETVVKEYIFDSSNDMDQIALLCEAIDDLINTTEFTSEEKKEFISELNSNTCNKENALDWLLKMKEYLIKNSN